MIRSVILVLSFVLVAGGCGDKAKEGSVRPPRTTTVTETDAIDIARSELNERDGWGDSATFEAVPAGNGWRISARGSGGEVVLIVVDGEGNVVQYQGS